MKTRHIFTYALCLLLTACYGLKPEEYSPLAPIDFEDDATEIDVSLGQELVYEGLQVKSILPLSYEWAYGKRKNGGDIHEMESMEVISTDPQIRYNFNKLGQFVLRLRVDNGESIVHRYYQLNVNSGLDEGLLILASDTEGKSQLCFIKKRSESEIAEGAQEIWEDVFKTMNPDEELTGGTALFLSAFSSDGISYNHLTVATDDSRGNIYDIEPKTMVKTFTTPMREQTGTHCLAFAGSQTAKTGAYTFMLGADGHVYRYDLFTPLITERTDVFTATGGVSGCKSLIYTTGSLNQKSAFIYGGGICQPATSATTTLRPTPAGWKIWNFCCDRDANKTYVLMQSETDATSWCIKTTGGTLASYEDVNSFSAGSVNMARDSKFCTSLHSNDAYYIYNDKVWRWSLSGQPASKPTYTYPNGELVCDIATNFMGNHGNGKEETLLYVATFSESTGKGNVYVYDISTDTLVASYKGICNKPVQLLYKYRIS